MIEKVNPSHPDKVADRIAGAIVDLAYRLKENPKMAVEVLIGHGYCKIMMETSLSNETVSEHLQDIYDAVDRINGKATATEVLYTAQDEHLSKNQEDIIFQHRAAVAGVCDLFPAAVAGPLGAGHSQGALK